jgi:type IV secretory pathway VirB10-like protein
MKLSESLQELSAHVKELEDSADATYEANRTKLETRSREIDAQLRADADAFQADIDDGVERGRAQWTEAKASAKRPLDEVRARIDKRHAEHEVHRAQRVADEAEQDAADAIDTAAYFLDVAEYTVIDAALARMAADDLAAVPSGGAS